MLEINLTTSIEKFMKNFWVVRRRHLDRFFRDRDPAAYGALMRHLTVDLKYIHDHGDDILSLAHPGKLPSPISAYTGHLYCLDMFTSTLKSSEVCWFDAADYPLNLRFLTISDELYDVAYLDENNWLQKYTLLPIAWKKGVPHGQKDPVNHIAVVPNLEVAMKLRDLAFTQFIVVDHNGAVMGIYDND